METLRERLMAEITKNEEMATQLELVSSKLRQTEELTGGQRSEFDVTSLGQINASLDDVALQGRVGYQDHCVAQSRCGNLHRHVLVTLCSQCLFIHSGRTV